MSDVMVREITWTEWIIVTTILLVSVVIVLFAIYGICQFTTRSSRATKLSELTRSLDTWKARALKLDEERKRIYKAATHFDNLFFMFADPKRIGGEPEVSNDAMSFSDGSGDQTLIFNSDAGDGTIIWIVDSEKYLADKKEFFNKRGKRGSN